MKDKSIARMNALSLFLIMTIAVLPCVNIVTVEALKR